MPLLPVYIEYTFNIPSSDPRVEILVTHLAEYGFESFMDGEEAFSAYIQESLLEEKKIRELIDSVLGGDKGIFSIIKIPPVNWNEEWEKNFSPVEISPVCRIRAPFHEPGKNVEYEIVMEPKMAFGTGHHPTTRLMIEKILVTNLRGRSSMDMGCGTGILAILASMKGSDPVWAADIDAQACENARENILCNKITNIHVDKGGAEILAGRVFDVILANINRNALLQDIPGYTGSIRRGGSMILSGFYREDIPVMLERAKELGLRAVDEQIRDNWALVELKCV